MGRDESTIRMQEAKHDDTQGTIAPEAHTEEPAPKGIFDRIKGAASAMAEAVGLKHHEETSPVQALGDNVDSTDDAIRQRDAPSAPEEQDERGVLSSAAHTVVDTTTAVVKGSVVTVAEKVGLVEEGRDAGFHDLLEHVKDVAEDAKDTVVDKAAAAKDTVIEKAEGAKDAVTDKARDVSERTTQRPQPTAGSNDRATAFGEEIALALRPASFAGEEEDFNSEALPTTAVDAPLPSLNDAPSLPSSETAIEPRATVQPNGISYAQAAAGQRSF